MADVVVEVEVGIVDPVRMVELERHLDQPPTHRFEPTEQRIETVVGDLVRIEVAIGSLVDRQAVDVTVGVGGLHVEETRIEAGQLLHALQSRAHSTAATPLDEIARRVTGVRSAHGVDTTVSELHYDEWMSESDSVLWHIERDPLLRSTITSVWFLDSLPNRARMDAVVDGIVEKIPRLRQRVIDEQPGVAPPRWADDPHVDLEYHYTWARLPGRRPGRRQVLDHAQRMGARAFDKDRPLWELCVIEGLPGQAGCVRHEGAPRDRRWARHGAAPPAHGRPRSRPDRFRSGADPCSCVDGTRRRPPCASRRRSGRFRAPDRSPTGLRRRPRPALGSARRRSEQQPTCCATPRHDRAAESHDRIDRPCGEAGDHPVESSDDRRGRSTRTSRRSRCRSRR